jgi:hypothetical protein
MILKQNISNIYIYISYIIIYQIYIYIKHQTRCVFFRNSKRSPTKTSDTSSRNYARVLSSKRLMSQNQSWPWPTEDFAERSEHSNSKSHRIICHDLPIYLNQMNRRFCQFCPFGPYHWNWGWFSEHVSNHQPAMYSHVLKPFSKGDHMKSTRRSSSRSDQGESKHVLGPEWLTKIKNVLNWLSINIHIHIHIHLHIKR